MSAPTLTRFSNHSRRRFGSCFSCLLLAFATSAIVSTTAQAQDHTDTATIQQAVATAQKKGNPVVELHTNLGRLQLELYPAKSPKSVENFLGYVNNKHYDGTVFHRVIEGFMIQGGGLDLRLDPKPTGQPVTNEADNGLSNQKFTLALARTGDPHSATAQFFINTANNDFLDHKSKTNTGWGYAVIGQVIGGTRIAEWMSKAPTGESDIPVTPIVIEKALLLSDK